MKEEIEEVLRDLLAVRGNEGVPLDAALFALRAVIMGYLRDHNLDPSTYSYDQLTLMAVKALCERGAVIV